MVTPKQALISSSVALALASVAPVGASELDVLKEQIQVLSQEVQQLKSDQNTVSYSRRAGAAKAGVGIVSGDKVRSMIMGDTQIQFGGFIMLQTSWDLDFEGADDSRPELLPSGAAIAAGTAVPNQTRFQMDARRSRFFIDAKKKTGNGTRVRGHLEWDFHGTPSPGNSDAPRLRHAYFDYGKLKVGQTWSNFTQFHAMVSQLNFFSGPGKTTTGRQSSARFTTGNISISLEEIRNVGLVGSIQEFPDIVGRWEQSFGAIKVGVSGVLGQIKTATDTDTGYALAFGGSWGLGKGSKVIAQFVTTEGRGRYINRSGIADAQNIAGVIVSGEIDAYSIGWKQKLGAGTMNLFYGINDYGVNSLLRDTTERFAINYTWSPAKGITFGTELMRGKRTDVGFSSVSSDRLLFQATYNFAR